MPARNLCNILIKPNQRMFLQMIIWPIEFLISDRCRAITGEVVSSMRADVGRGENSDNFSARWIEKDPA